MDSFNPYEAPPSALDPPERAPRPRRVLKGMIEGTAAGLVIALLDLNSAGDPAPIALAILAAGFVLGARHGAAAGVLAWLPLGGLIYVVHLIAIVAFGYEPPFVERDVGRAAESLAAFSPAGFGLLFGLMARSAWMWFRPPHAEDDTKPPDAAEPPRRGDSW